MRFNLHAALEKALLSERFAGTNFSVLEADAFREAGTFDRLYRELVSQERVRSFTEERQEQQVRNTIYAMLAQLEKWHKKTCPEKLLTIRYLQSSYIDSDNKIHGTLSVLVGAPGRIEYQDANNTVYFPLSIDPTNARECQFDVNFGDFFAGPVTDDDQASFINHPAALSIAISEKADPSLEQPKRVNIMLVDDGNLEIKFLKMLVKQIFGENLMKHVALVVATNGSEAVAKTEVLINSQGRSFDFITMDYHMPAKKGDQAIEEIRELENQLNDKSTIIGFSNLTPDSEAYVNFIHALGGADNLLGKPILTQQAELSAKLAPLKEQLELAIQESMGENQPNQPATPAALSM